MDAGLLMVSAAAANYLIGIGFDNWHMTPRALAWMLGGLLIVPGLLWLPVQAAWGGNLDLDVRTPLCTSMVLPQLLRAVAAGRRALANQHLRNPRDAS